MFHLFSDVCSGVACSRQGRHCARAIRPARSRTFKCLEIAGTPTAKASASSDTEALPRTASPKLLAGWDRRVLRTFRSIDRSLSSKPFS